jgi:hypothetical protein
VSIPHLKVFEIENGYPKYWISACVEAIWAPLVLAIMASSLLLFAINPIVIAQQRCICGIAFGDTKLPKSIESKLLSTKIECTQLSFGRDEWLDALHSITWTFYNFIGSIDFQR